MEYMKKPASRSFMRDPRIQSTFQQMLKRKPQAQAPQPKGVDHARAQQGVNAVKGAWTHRNAQRPKKLMNTLMQNYYRNRSNEQAGVGTPAAPQQADPMGFAPKRNT